MNKPKSTIILKYTFIFIFIFISSIGISQSIAGVNFGYGIPYYKIINNSKSEINYTPKNLYDIELVYKKRWPGILNFGSSISYQFQGSHFDVEESSPIAYVYQSRDYKLHFINIKAFPEFVFGDLIKFYLQVGPSMSFLIYSNINGYTDVSKDKNSETKIRTEDSGSANEVFDVINFLLFTSAGVDIPINNKIMLSVAAQFQYNTNSWFSVEDNTYSDRSIIFKLGLTYKLQEVSDK